MACTRPRAYRRLHLSVQPLGSGHHFFRSTPTRSRHHLPWATSLIAFLRVAAPASATVTRAEAGKAAIAAFGARDRDGGEIVFAAAEALQVGAVVREASPAGSARDKTDSRGITSSRLRTVARVRGHRAWLF